MRIKIKKVFKFLHENPKHFPKFESEEALVVDLKDYIAGMTDGFLVAEFEKILGEGGF